MDVLKQTRGRLKGTITRIVKFVSEVTEDVETEMLEVRLERLEETWKSFCRNQDELYVYHNTEGYSDPEVDFEATETKYLTAKSALLKAIRKGVPVSKLTSESDNLIKQQAALIESFVKKPLRDDLAQKPSVEIDLPAFKITPFSGDYREWPGFRDMFVGTIDCKKNLPDAQKLRYLKSFLRDDAAKLLNQIEIADCNYKVAWERLDNRYNKPPVIVNAYIESFLKLPNVSANDSVKLRGLTDNADEVIRGLKALGADGRDPWLVYILLNKVDAETRKAWAFENKGLEEATVSALIEFLGQRCSALEASEPKTRANKPPSRSNAPQHVRSLTVCNSFCPKCNENHKLPQCLQFKSMSVPARRDFVRDQKLCYNCLGTNHSSARCRSKIRCSECQTRHHSLVHLNKSHSPIVEKKSDIPNSLAADLSADKTQTLVMSNYVGNDTRLSGILPTVLVNIKDYCGNLHPCRALLDTGSQVSFVSEKLVKRLGLRRRHARISINGISSLEAGVTNGITTIKLLSRFNDSQLEVEAFILNNITSQTPLHSFKFNCPSLLQNNRIADPGFNKSGPIDILLGSDKVWNILCDGRHFDEEGNLIAQNTVFGWVLTGSEPDRKITSLHANVTEDLDLRLKSFWEIEELPHDSLTGKFEDQADSHFVKTVSRAPDGKYVVELPFRYSDVKFSNTLDGALSCLSAMERRFERNPHLRNEYIEFMKTYAELGHMERVYKGAIEPTSGHVFYLPHHAVVTNKIRVVFDGSHKDSHGNSLNEMLHIGPPLQRNLINVCLRFRMHKYVFCADIVKMFRQIWVHPKHRDYQRIIWRESPDSPIEHYRLCTVTYGTSAAPFLSMRVLRQVAMDFSDKFPVASRSILRDFYVDDLLTGADSVSEVMELKNQLLELLAKGGFELSKWSSNCWSVLTEIACNDMVSLDLKSEMDYTKVLGLVWNPYRDKLTFKISLEKESFPCTKRKPLSEVAKIFDPLGFLSPSTILLKILFQELWLHKDKLNWDDPLPKEVADQWTHYRQALHNFEGIEIARRCTLNSRYFDLIGFSDASEKAYSAVVYMRSVSEDNQVDVQLVAAKTRVAPVKQLSIPRLELCGALLLSRLIKLISSSLDSRPRTIVAFCDSKVVLAWLASPPRRWSTFVGNRTSEILDVLPRSTWNHISSEENPADCASRGIPPSELLSLELWWKGPSWISRDFKYWPVIVEDELEEVPEIKKSSAAVHVIATAPHFMDDLSTRISSWTRLVRIVAYIFRFVKNCRLSSKERNTTFISSAELLTSKQYCLSYAQREFREDINALKSNHFVSNRSKLSSLSPFLDEFGLLRVGGRIANAENVPFSTKHPIILPKNHAITYSIILEAHTKYLHAGVSNLFALIRQQFWVFGSRNLIRKIVFKCIKCFRLRQKTSTQLMGNLPASRLSPSYAFDQSGCDYAGPIMLRLSKGRKPKLVKGYIAVFVCMATRALHLEVVSDLSTDAFLAALQRFVARRGKCSIIYSDNGTNFQGASRILSEWFQLVRSREHNEKVVSTLAGDNIKWEFIPPHSPHFGGLWEAGVRCVKQHLRRVLGNNILTFEEMSTLLSQIEALLNSRPLSTISDSDLNPLTPSHFLIGRPHTAIPEPNYSAISTNRLGRWELVQNMVQGFWRRWQSDYVTSLQQRPKWQQVTRNFKVDDIVVVKEPNLPPSKWSLGRITEVHPGKDGLVRVVSVRCNDAIYKRPITKLALLPIS